MGYGGKDYGYTEAGYGYGVTSGAAFNVQAKVGTFNSATVTGNQSVTGIGFTPKAILPFGGYQNSPASTTNLFLSFGCGVASSLRACISTMSQNGATTTNTRRRHTNERVFEPISTAGTALQSADLASLDTDGFTFNWSLADPVARIVNTVSLGGSTLEANLVQCQMNNTNAAQSFAHGLSGAPTAILLFSAINATAPANTATGLHMSLGAWAGGSQVSTSLYSENGVTTTVTRYRASTSHAIARLTTSVQRSLAISSVDATNVNVTYPDTISTSQDYFWMLCLRGCKAQVGTFYYNNSLDPFTLSCPGIVPKLFLPVFLPLPPDAVRSEVLFTIGAFDGTTMVSCGIQDRNSVTTTNARRHQSSTTIAEYDNFGSKVSEASVSFVGNSVVVDPTTVATATWGRGGYLIIGE